jgi:cytochrome oxidase Cu insertion factor (SCO1/SenC/PrrC family)
MEDRLTASLPRLAGRHRASLAALGAILVITLAWWALALWPLPAAASPVLLRARTICFGTADNGLPSGTGWMMLIGEPIMITLLLLSVAGGTTIREGLREIARSTLGRLTLRAITLTGLVALAAAGARVAYALGVGAPAVARSSFDVAGATRLDRPAPALGLVDQRGAPVTITALRGRPVLVTFAYAHCETVCPLIVHEVVRAREQLVDRKPYIVVITLDPWRDTPSRLTALARQWALPEDASVLSGPVPEVQAALDRWGVARTRNTQTGEITHPQVVYVLDREGRIAFSVTGDADAIAQLVRQL